MNKLFTKIAALCLGATMAVGVGVAVASNGSAKVANAAYSGTGTFEKTAITSLSDGDVILIVKDDAKAMSNNNGTGSAPTATSVTVSNNKITNPATTLIWTIGVSGSNYTFLAGESGSNYLYCTNTNNGVRVGTNSNKVFTMDSSGYLKNTATSRYLGVYNNQDWRCYTSTGGNIANQTFSFYKLAAAKTLSSISVSSDHRSFNVGDTFIKETVTATYDDESTSDVTSNATFTGYNMSNTGNQTVNVSYTEGSVTKNTSYSITVNVAKYAVSYNANGGTGTMTDPNSPYNSGTTVTVLGNSFTAPTNCEFTNWNTSADGSGTAYNPGATFTINSATTLYAQWAETISSGTTTYVFTSKSWEATVSSTTKNWASGKDGNSLQSGQGIQVTTGVTGANGTSPAYFNHVKQIVVQYCTNASSGVGSIKVQVGTGSEKTFNVTKPSSGGTTLKNATFDFNPKENGKVKVTGLCTTNSIYIYGVSVTCQQNAEKLDTPSPAYNDGTKTVSWSSIANASSYSYKIGSGSWTDNGSSLSHYFATPGTYTFYVKAIGDGTNYSDSDSSAGLQCVVTAYHVTYNGNGNTDGSVPTDATDYALNASVTVSGNTGSLVKENASPAFNYVFAGWTLNPDGSGTVYGPGEGQTHTYTITQDVDFYAKWEDPRTVIALLADNVNMDLNDADLAPTITSSPTGHADGYQLSSASPLIASIVDNKIHPVAVGTSQITASKASDSSYKYVSAVFTVTISKSMDDNGTGTINFGSAEGSTKIDGSSVTGPDSQDNEWTVTTTGTTSFTPQPSFNQIGSSKAPATTITFSTTLSKTVKIQEFSAKFGGFSGTTGSISLKIGSVEKASGSLSADADVTVGGDIADTTGNTLSVSVTGIDKGVKVYYISYTYITEVPVTGVTLSPSEINLAPNGVCQLTATVAPANATNKGVTFTSNNPTVATVSSEGLVEAKVDGNATITVSTNDGGYTATCSVTVATPVGAYVNIAPTLMGIAGNANEELNITYGGTFTGTLDAVSSNDNIEVLFIDNEDGTGTVLVEFDKPGTAIISFVDGSEPIENEGSTCTVTVVERLNTINAYEQTLSDMTFTQKYETGGATATDGTEWVVSSDADEETFAADGLHYGSNSKSVQYIELTTTFTNVNIKEVIVRCRDSKEVGTVSVTLGSGSVTCTGSTAATNTSSDFTFIGSGSGSITVAVSRANAQNGALYLKSVKVVYESTTPTNIANTSTVVQKQVLDFVTTMNADLAVCSTQSLTTSVWSTLSGKYTTAKNASDDSELFEKMFAYASATPRASDGSATTGDSLQNALARYDYILTKYGTDDYPDFLGRTIAGTVSAPSSPRILIPGVISNEVNTTAIIVIVSVISVTAIGGYFFLRKRREEN